MAVVAWGDGMGKSGPQRHNPCNNPSSARASCCSWLAHVWGMGLVGVADSGLMRKLRRLEPSSVRASCCSWQAYVGLGGGIAVVRVGYVRGKYVGAIRGV